MDAAEDPKLNPEDAGGAPEVTAAPNLNPPPEEMEKPSTGALGASNPDFFGATFAPGLGVSQQTQASLSASLGTMQALKLVKVTKL